MTMTFLQGRVTVFLSTTKKTIIFWTIITYASSITLNQLKNFMEFSFQVFSSRFKNIT